jgi:hypothetical protein
LDDKLGELLKASMIQDREYEEEIGNFFRDPGPLGSFSAGIKLAHYLNIISLQVPKDLDIIRKIRNDLGHKLKYEDFNSLSIKARCMNLQHDLLEDNQIPHERFINAANVLIVLIDFFRENNMGVFSLARNPRDRRSRIDAGYTERCRFRARVKGMTDATAVSRGPQRDPPHHPRSYTGKRREGSIRQANKPRGSKHRLFASQGGYY